MSGFAQKFEANVTAAFDVQQSSLWWAGVGLDTSWRYVSVLLFNILGLSFNMLPFCLSYW